jgi:protein-ribulosamine 3-kinase
MQSALKAALEQHLGSAVLESASIAGGDINQTLRVRLADGRKLFVKTHPQPLPDMFACEARGLAWLRETATLRVPSVIASSDATNAPAFLAMELIESAPRAADYDERLGRGLAALHRCRAPVFGFERDNFIATLAQDNRACDTWPRFYLERRLQPQLALAVNRGRSSRAMQTGFARLFARIEDLCGPPEPPSRLHGDLWGGNAIADEHGLPVLIDPAVYAGHREIDLAMMELFGGFGSRCFRAYDEVYPRAPGHEERIALYQLYPLLVHVNLFGGSYVASIERALVSLI